MCTLIVGFNPQSENSLIIGANRDENPTRPSEPWNIRQNNPKVYCPLDVRKGTWIGVNSLGFFCAITNWDIGNPFKGLKSRGEVVLETLKRNSKKDIQDYWNSLNPNDYKPFNILAGGNDWLINLSCDHKNIKQNELSSGIHISTGCGFNQLTIREQYIHNIINLSIINSNDIKLLLSHHNDDNDPENCVCVHDPEHLWETRSSSLLILNKDHWEIQEINTTPCKNVNWNISKLEIEK